MDEYGLERRRFLKYAGATAAAVVGLSALGWDYLMRREPTAPSGKSTKGPVLVKDEALIPDAPENFQQTRHLVLRGSNRDIGRTLAEIARRDLGVDKLAKYADSIYGEARRTYLKDNFAALYERSLGVADAFGLAEDDTRFDTTTLPYDLGSLACSSVCFPPNTTANGHTLVSRNMEWYTVSAVELLTGKKAPQAPVMGKHGFIAEFYPDQDCASMQTTFMELLNFPMDGINEHGLSATALVDQQGRGQPIPGVGGHDAGLSTMHVISLLMTQCKTVREAKLMILRQRIFFPVEALHWVISDPTGASTIFEADSRTGEYVFVDGNEGKPQVCTNHALHVYPTPASFPQTDPKANYNTFNRFRTLQDAVDSRQDKFTVDDCFQILSKVYGATDDAEEAGAHNPYPIRTLWTFVMDLTDRTIYIKYYLRDASKIEGTKGVNLLLTDPIKIRLSPSAGSFAT